MTERQHQRTPDQLAQLEAMKPTIRLVLGIIGDHGELPMDQLFETVDNYRRRQRGGGEPPRLQLGPHNSLEELVRGMSRLEGFLTKKSVNGTTILSVSFQGHRFLAAYDSTSH